MKIITRLTLTLVSLLLLIPSAAAHDIIQTDNLYFSAEASLYRQKELNRPWQLAVLPSGATIRQTLQWQNKIWLVVEVAGRVEMYQQISSLRFEPVGSVDASEQMILRVVGNRLFVWCADGANRRLFVLGPDRTPRLIQPSLLLSQSDLDRMVVADDQTFYLALVGSVTQSYRLEGENWQLQTQLNCAGSTVMQEPLSGLICDDGRVFGLQDDGSWLDLGLQLQKIGRSGDLLVGWDTTQPGLVRIWHDNNITNVQLTLTSDLVDDLRLRGERILIKKHEDNWQELLWQSTPPQLLDLTSTKTGTIVTTDNPDLVLVNGDTPQLSRQAGQWQLMLTQGTFDRAASTHLGTLIWNSGSLTQFASGQATEFIKVNPWSSSTSPIQTAYIGPTTSFVTVITQSGTGNVNLYKTTNFTAWSRITLPTKPTQSVDVSTARQLPAGDLVELEGVLTVGPNVVDDEVVYLEDETAGIQIYLNKSNGTLPKNALVNAVVTGEISSSQAKRVIIGEASDLELADSANWDFPAIYPNEADRYLGRAVSLSGSAGQIETDSFYLTRQLQSLKVHLVAAKTSLHPDDQLALKAVVDWNSSSGSAEAWSLDGSYQLLSRAEVTPATTKTSSASQSKAPAVKSASSAVPTASLLAINNEKSSTPTLVESSQTKSTTDSQTLPMSVVSLLAGLVAVRGRRLRAVLNY